MQLRLQTFLNSRSEWDFEVIMREALLRKDQEIRLLKGRLNNTEEELLRKKKELVQVNERAFQEADSAQKVKIDL